VVFDTPRLCLIFIVRVRSAWHSNDETTPLPWFGGHLDMTAMLLDGGLGNMQA
jgi:hypothetical protein